MSREHVLEREQRVALPLAETFAIYADARNLERITPPWLRFKVLEPTPASVREGTLIAYRLRLRGLPIRWLTRIDVWDPPHRFVDRQLRGPYALWHHTHEFEAHGDSTTIRDRVRYRIGFGPLGDLALRLFVRRDLERIFDYRREAILTLIRERSGGARAPGDRAGV